MTANLALALAVLAIKSELGCRLTGVERLLPWRRSVIAGHWNVPRRPSWPRA